MADYLTKQQFSALKSLSGNTFMGLNKRAAASLAGLLSGNPTYAGAIEAFGAKRRSPFVQLQYLKSLMKKDVKSGEAAYRAGLLAADIQRQRAIGAYGYAGTSATTGAKGLGGSSSLSLWKMLGTA